MSARAARISASSVEPSAFARQSLAISNAAVGFCDRIYASPAIRRISESVGNNLPARPAKNASCSGPTPCARSSLSANRCNSLNAGKSSSISTSIPTSTSRGSVSIAFTNSSTLDAASTRNGLSPASLDAINSDADSSSPDAKSANPLSSGLSGKCSLTCAISSCARSKSSASTA